MAVPQHDTSNRRFVSETPDFESLNRAPLDMMPTSDFDSSNVHSGLYDFGERELYMRYLREGSSDAIYQYWDVPAATWRGLKMAASKGGYINEEIAYDYEYALFGRGDFPDRSAISNGLFQRFVHDP